MSKLQDFNNQIQEQFSNVLLERISEASKAADIKTSKINISNYQLKCIRREDKTYDYQVTIQLEGSSLEGEDFFFVDQYPADNTVPKVSPRKGVMLTAKLIKDYLAGGEKFLNADSNITYDPNEGVETITITTQLGIAGGEALDVFEAIRDSIKEKFSAKNVKDIDAKHLAEILKHAQNQDVEALERMYEDNKSAEAANKTKVRQPVEEMSVDEFDKIFGSDEVQKDMNRLAEEQQNKKPKPVTHKPNMELKKERPAQPKNPGKPNDRGPNQ